MYVRGRVDIRRLWLAVAVLAMTAGLAGCGDGTQGRTRAESTPPAVSIEQMTPEQKARISPTFPMQVPVPSGEIVGGGAQGADWWGYELVMPQTPGQVADWYEERMIGANWQLVKSSPRENGSFELTFAKQQAEMLVYVSEESSGSRVVATVGLGPAVLEQQ